MTSFRIIFAGSGEFGLPTLRALVDAGHDVVQVVSQPDRPAGRGRELTPTPISKFAVERNLPLLRTQNINDEQLPPADLLVVIAFGQKIAPHVVDHARLGSVNLHSSRLPKYRGAAPINWAIINGETVTGNSIIRHAQKMDAGACLAQPEVKIIETETAGELHDRLAADGAALMTGFIEDLINEHVTEMPQDESLATMAPKLSRETSRIDWNRPEVAIANQIRGMYPWPGCRIRLIDKSGAEMVRATLCRARRTGAKGLRTEPGVINDEGHIGVADGGSIEILELQPEGKRPMSLKDYRNGRPWEPGMRVESIS
jgi:methionyl-tRNA formyltransferase